MAIDDFRSPKIIKFFICVLYIMLDKSSTISSTFFFGSIKTPFLFIASSKPIWISVIIRYFSSFEFSNIKIGYG
jgi:hypothetical protein